MSEKKLNIHQRINAVMKDLKYVQKEDKKVNNQYTFVSHDAVTAAVRVHLVEHGIVVIPTVIAHTQDGNRTEVDLQVAFVNIDDPKDMVSVCVFGYGVDQQDKGPGKAFSYAKKYAFLQLFALETGDDPERDNKDHEPEKKKATSSGPLGITALKKKVRELSEELKQCEDIIQIDGMVVDYKDALHQCSKDLEEWYDGAMEAIERRKTEIRNEQ